jgi:hypothetical protein
MDHTQCDYDKGFRHHRTLHPELKFPQSVLGLYINLIPIQDAIESFNWLSKQSDYLTAQSIRNSHCYSENVTG